MERNATKGERTAVATGECVAGAAGGHTSADNRPIELGARKRARYRAVEGCCTEGEHAPVVPDDDVASALPDDDDVDDVGRRNAGRKDLGQRAMERCPEGEHAAVASHEEVSGSGAGDGDDRSVELEAGEVASVNSVAVSRHHAVGVDDVVTVTVRSRRDSHRARASRA